MLNVLLLQRPGDPDVRSWRAAALANGGIVLPSESRKITKFVRKDKLAGWTKRGDMAVGKLSSALAARTTLKLHNLMTAGGSASHSPGRGFDTTAANSYYDTGYNYNTVAVGSGNDIHMSSSEYLELGSTSISIGNVVSSGTKSILLESRSGSNSFFGVANSATLTYNSGTQTTSLGLFTVTRSGSTYTGWINGVSQGTSAPGTNGTVQPAINVFLGCRNNNSTPDSFRPNFYDYWSCGADISGSIAASDAAVAELLASFPLPDTFVTASGSDSTGNGTSGTPYATLAKGLTNTREGGRIYFPATPAAMAATVTVAKSVTFAGVTTAVLAGFDTTRVLLITASGKSVAFQNLTISPALNVGGAAIRGIDITVTALPVAVSAVGCVFTDPGSGGFCIGCNSNLLKATIDLRSCTFTSDGPRNQIGSTNVTSGSLTMSGNTITMTGLTASGNGSVSWIAANSGVGFSSSSDTASITCDPSAVSGLYYGIYAENCLAGLIQNATVTFNSNGSSAQMGPIWLAYNSLHDDGTVLIDGSIVRNCTVHCRGGGGSGALIGADTGGNGHASQCNNCLMDTVVVDGDAAGVTAGLHMHFLGNTTDSRVQNCTGTTGGLGAVSKHNTRAYWYNNTYNQQNSAYLLAKGDTNTTFDGNTVNITLGYEGDGIRCEDETVSGDHSTGTVVKNNIFTVTGTTAAAVVVGTSNTATFTNNTYNAFSGGVFTFSYQGSTLTPAQWKATIEPTAQGNIF